MSMVRINQEIFQSHHSLQLLLKDGIYDRILTRPHRNTNKKLNHFFNYLMKYSRDNVVYLIFMAVSLTIMPEVTEVLHGQL